jgi:hypothetical protein
VECRYAECRYAECRYAECRYVSGRRYHRYPPSNLPLPANMDFCGNLFRSENALAYRKITAPKSFIASVCSSTRRQSKLIRFIFIYFLFYLFLKKVFFFHDSSLISKFIIEIMTKKMFNFLLEVVQGRSNKNLLR